MSLYVQRVTYFKLDFEYTNSALKTALISQFTKYELATRVQTGTLGNWYVYPFRALVTLFSQHRLAVNDLQCRRVCVCLQKKRWLYVAIFSALLVLPAMICISVLLAYYVSAYTFVLFRVTKWNLYKSTTTLKQRKDKESTCKTYSRISVTILNVITIKQVNSNADLLSKVKNLVNVPSFVCSFVR